MSEWQPAASAPTNGIEFDAWCVHPDSESMGVRISDVQMRLDLSGFGFITHLGDRTEWNYLEPKGRPQTFPTWIMTHWMPKPEAPETNK